jgi:hypothetical protein
MEQSKKPSLTFRKVFPTFSAPNKPPRSLNPAIENTEQIRPFADPFFATFIGFVQPQPKEQPFRNALG